MAVTREQVFQICDQVFAEGLKVTNERVRSRLGEGSFSTISKLIREWKETQIDLTAMPTSEPVTLPAEVLALFERAYGAAVAQAQGVENSERITLLEQENDRYRLALAELQGAKEELQGLKYAYQQQLNRTEALIRENEQLAKGVSAEAAPIIEELESKIEELQGQLAQAFTQLKAAADVEKELSARIDQKQELLQIEEQELKRLAAQNKILIEENQQLRIQAAQIKSLTEQIDQLKLTNDALTQKLGAKGEQMTSINGELFYIDPLLARAIAAERESLMSELNDLKAQPSIINVQPFTQSLSQAELAKRLGIHSGTLTKKKGLGDFPDWSQSKDPEGWAWNFDPASGRFVRAGAAVDAMPPVENSWESPVEAVVGEL